MNHLIDEAETYLRRFKISEELEVTPGEGSGKGGIPDEVADAGCLVQRLVPVDPTPSLPDPGARHSFLSSGRPPGLGQRLETR